MLAMAAPKVWPLLRHNRRKGCEKTRKVATSLIQTCGYRVLKFVCYVECRYIEDSEIENDID